MREVRVVTAPVEGEMRIARKFSRFVAQGVAEFRRGGLMFRAGGDMFVILGVDGCQWQSIRG